MLGGNLAGPLGTSGTQPCTCLANGICFFCAVTPPALGGNGCEIGCDAIRSLPFREKCNRIGHISGLEGGPTVSPFSFPITGFTHGGAVSSSSAAGDERAAKAGPGQCQETSAAGQSHGGGESPMGVGAWEGALGKGGLMWQDDLE
jgi:hypothetical protein